MHWIKHHTKQLVLTAFLGITGVTMIIWVPPFHPMVVAVFVLVCAGFAASAASMALPLKYTYIVGLAVCLFLGMAYLTGFQILNIILLACFIIGLTLLVR